MENKLSTEQIALLIVRHNMKLRTRAVLYAINEGRTVVGCTNRRPINILLRLGLIEEYPGFIGSSNRFGDPFGIGHRIKASNINTEEESLSLAKQIAHTTLSVLTKLTEEARKEFFFEVLDKCCSNCGSMTSYYECTCMRDD